MTRVDRRLRAAWSAVPTTSRVLALFAAWVVTRLLLTVVVQDRVLYPSQADSYELSIYAVWGDAFRHGTAPVPLRDGPWEYPAATALVIVLPALLHGVPYVLGFVSEMLLVDLAGLLLLLRWGLHRGSLGGAALWVVGPLLVGPIFLSRFDLVPTVLAAGALAAGATGAPLLAGVLLGSGFVLKLWPGLLVPLLLVRSRRDAVRTVTGATGVVVLLVLVLAWWGGLRQALSFLTYQRDRGLELESLPANALMLVELLGGAPTTVDFAFGSFQLHGPGEHLLGHLSTAVLVALVLLVAVLAWRARHAPEPAQVTIALAVLLVSALLLTNKVLSAQYPVWLLGPVALGLCWPGSRLRSTVPALLGALALTQVVYPLRFDDLIGREPHAVLVLTARNLLLVVLAVQALRICLAAARHVPVPDVPRAEPHAEPHAAPDVAPDGEGAQSTQRPAVNVSTSTAISGAEQAR